MRRKTMLSARISKWCNENECICNGCECLKRQSERALALLKRYPYALAGGYEKIILFVFTDESGSAENRLDALGEVRHDGGSDGAF